MRCPCQHGLSLIHPNALTSLPPLALLALGRRRRRRRRESIYTHTDGPKAASQKRTGLLPRYTYDKQSEKNMKVGNFAKKFQLNFVPTTACSVIFQQSNSWQKPLCVSGIFPLIKVGDSSFPPPFSTSPFYGRVHGVGELLPYALYYCWLDSLATEAPPTERKRVVGGWATSTQEEGGGPIKNS